MGIARDFKFGARIDRRTEKQKNAKVGQKGRGLRHMTYFYNFGTRLYLEWVKLQTFSLVCGLSSRTANQKRKSRSIGACPALRDLIFKFWDTVHISGMGIARDFKFGMRIDRLACKPKNA